MPAARQVSTSPFIALAVSATMGRRRPEPSSSSRTRAVASKPSITGIRQSISTSSTPPPAMASTADWPSPTTCTW